MKKTLYILRGCSGSGKSTLASNLGELYEASYGREYVKSFEADKFFYTEDGTYDWSIEGLPVSHAKCFSGVKQSMLDKVPVVILSNTTCRQRDLKEYLELAERMDYDVVSLVVEHRHNGENLHGVDAKQLLKQESQLRGSLKLTNIQKEK